MAAVISDGRRDALHDDLAHRTRQELVQVLPVHHRPARQGELLVDLRPSLLLSSKPQVLGHELNPTENQVN